MKLSHAARKRLIIIGFALLHLFATGLFSFSMIGLVLQRTHYGASPELARQEIIIGAISQILEFPLMPFARFALGAKANGLTPLTWLLNSALWSWCVYSLVAFVTAKIKRQ